MSAAKMTHADRKAVRVEAKDKKEKFGLKTDKQLTTSKYVFYMTPELEAIADKPTVAALLSGIETCYKKFGPAPWFYAEFLRDGTPGKWDPYLNASGLATLFSAKAGDAVGPRLQQFVEHKDFVHQVNHVVAGDDEEFKRVVANIKALTSEQFMFIVNHALKLTGGVAVPVFYYKVETEFGNESTYVSPTRYLDHPKNLPEAQFKLANGLTTNRPWAVRPEHLEAYAVLEAEYLAKKAAKEKEDKEKYEKFGEPHHNEPGFAEAFMAKLALEKAAKGV
jgi:hypothetical protein